MKKHSAHFHSSVMTGAIMIAIVTMSGGASLSPLHLSTSPTPAAAERTARMKMGSIEELRAAMRERTELLQRRVSVSFLPETGTAVTVLDVALAAHPDWVRFEADLTGTAHPTIDAARVTTWLTETTAESLSSARSCTITRSWQDAQNVQRIETDCQAESGYTFDVRAAAQDIKEALEKNVSAFNVALQSEKGTLSGNDENIVNGTLTLLASGQSNFKGSGEGRKSNVRKAVNEQVNNIVIPQGATFSFNSALGGKVTLGAGWKMALTIFNGNELRPFPGGGICQASTTVYRAALNAGLPIVKQKSHSLFVTYYEKYGVGLDATIFPGQQDFSFVNDTAGPIVLQSYTEGDEAVVNIFGIDDGRSVVLSGPYFSATAPENLLIKGQPIRKNEIAWQRNVRLPNGEERSEVFAARYNAIPKSLAKRSPATTVQARGYSNIAMQDFLADNR